MAAPVQARARLAEKGDKNPACASIQYRRGWRRRNGASYRPPPRTPPERLGHAEEKRRPLSCANWQRRTPGAGRLPDAVAVQPAFAGHGHARRGGWSPSTGWLLQGETTALIELLPPRRAASFWWYPTKSVSIKMMHPVSRYSPTNRDLLNQRVATVCDQVGAGRGGLAAEAERSKPANFTANLGYFWSTATNDLRPGNARQRAQAERG